MVAAPAALSEANEAPPLARRRRGARPGRHRIARDAQRPLKSFGVTQPAPPTGVFGLPFALLDGGSRKHKVLHGDPLNVVLAPAGAVADVDQTVRRRAL